MRHARRALGARGLIGSLDARGLIAVAVVAAMVGAPSIAKDARGDDAHEPSVAYEWNRVMLEAIERNPPSPTATTWRMFVIWSAVFDAWAAYDDEAVSTQHGAGWRRPEGERTDANAAAAVSYAAHRTLTTLYPAQRALFDARLAELGLAASDSTDVANPAGVGNVAARAVLDDRYADGSNAGQDFAQITSEVFPQLYTPVNSSDPAAPNAPGGPHFDPNRWQPLAVPTGSTIDASGIPVVDFDDPSSFVEQEFLTPHWGAVEPFAMRSGDQFRPPAPPQAGSPEPYTDALGNVSTGDEAYHRQMDQVMALNAALTDEHKVMAEFWADGPHTWTPPGHWNQLALGLSIRDRHTLEADVKMFFALNGALLDAGIAAWDAKRTFDFVRPITAIHHHYGGRIISGWGGPDQGTQLIDGSDWRPYQSMTFVTPPFAEYVSGHSTFSRAAAEALAAFTGSDALYDGTTRLREDFDGDGQEDLLGRHVARPGALGFESGPAETVVLSWDTLREAADEAGISRLYGGIHFQDGDRWGRWMGSRIGPMAFDRAVAHWDPLGHLHGMLGELEAAGEIRPVAGRFLERRIGLADGHFEGGRTAAGCASLRVAARQVDILRDRGVGEAAHAELSAALEFVHAKRCA